MGNLAQAKRAANAANSGEPAALTQARWYVEYLDAGGAWDVTPEAAVEFFRAKGLKPTFAWQDMIGAEHDAAFTIAKMMDTDMLEDVREALDESLARGGTFAEFKKQIVPMLKSKGWWGKQAVVDPLTGQETLAQLGSSHRLKTIFRTNMQNAYAVGNWEKIQQQADQAPFLLYDAVDDHRTRPEHEALDGTLLPADHKFWKSHYPPNGWNCRCGVIQLDAQDMIDNGLEVTPAPRIKYKNWTNPRTGKTYKVPEDLDPGWDHNPGEARMQKLLQLQAEKIQAIADQKAQEAAQLAAQKAVKAKVAYQASQAAQLAAKELSKAQGAAALKRGKAQVLKRAAQAQLDDIAKNNPPYLGAALKQVEKTKVGKTLGPVEKLAEVKAKAIKAEQSAALAHYKQAILKGKTPSKKANDAFVALPQEAQDSILAQLQAQLQEKAAKEAAEAAAKAAEKEAADKLFDILENPKGQTLKNKILKEKIADDPYWLQKPSTEQLAIVEDLAAKAQAKASQSAVLSGYKQKILQNKTPTPAQQKVWDSLTPIEQEDYLKKWGPAISEVAEYKTIYQDVFGKLPNEKEILGFIKSKKKTKKEVMNSLNGKLLAKAQAEIVELKVIDIKEVPVTTAGPPKQWQDLTLEEKYKALYHYTGAEDAGGYPDPNSGFFKQTTDKYKHSQIDELLDFIAENMDENPLDAAESVVATAAAKGEQWAIKGVTPKAVSKFDDLPLDDQYDMLVKATGEEKSWVPVGQWKTLPDEHKSLDIEILKAHAVPLNIDLDKLAKGKSAKLGPTVTDKIDQQIQALDAFDINQDDPIDWLEAHLAKLDTKEVEGDKWLEALYNDPDALFDWDPQKIMAEYKTALIAQKNNLLGKPSKKPKPTKTATKPAAVKTLDGTKAQDKPDAPEDWSDKALTKTGAQQGSNEGGFYRDTETGTDYYLKFPANDDIARNEVLASKLYQKAGTDIPELTLIKRNGRVGVASKIIDGLKKNKTALTEGKVTGIHEDFVTDAWLANWDVVGLEYDNLLVKNGKAYRIDPGGALRYRAMGGLKGGDFKKTVPEIDSLRNASLNPQSASVFGKITDDQIKAGAAKVTKITDDEIRALVSKYGPTKKAERTKLANTLIARKEWIKKKYGLENTPEAKAAKAEAIAEYHGEVQTAIADLNQKLTTAIKGIAYRSSSLSDLEAKDITRVRDAKKAYNDLFKQTQYLQAESVADLDNYYRHWIDELEKTVKGGAGSKAQWNSGFFYGFQEKLKVNEALVPFEIPVPGAKKSFTVQQANKILKESVGYAATRVRGPRPNNPIYSKLHSGHKKIINSYTGSHYSRINQELYEKRASKSTRDYRDLLNEALALAKPYKGKATRGMTLSGDKLKRFVDGHMRAAQTGEEVRYLSFASSGAGVHGWSGNVQIVFESKHGVHVRDLSSHPNDVPGGEVLFSANTRYKVDRVEKRAGQNNYTFYVRDQGVGGPVDPDLEFVEET